MKKLLVAAAALLAVPGAAQAAPPNPFGHACTPQNAVLFCPTASDAERVPSFDGVPMDVDVTLPASGDGPFPTIVLMHGWGGNKRSFLATAPEGNGGSSYHYNNVYFAQQGYAVVNPSARGFGRSCGAADSRTSPGCDRGWLHLADHRYEIRDTQYLLGLLADQGITRPGAIGVTGVSYGGMQSLSLARLRDASGSRTAATGLGAARTASRCAWRRPMLAGADPTWPTRCSRTAAISTSSRTASARASSRAA
jgi:predicted acyl esterase